VIDELVTWGTRLFELLPEVMSLWNAAKAKDRHAELEASLALVRRMEDMQAREEIG
jgi:hypothetical protein